MLNDCVPKLPPVHCRVGSLEKHGQMLLLMKQVHCRVGSLETMKK